jgi:hypothetical protein
MPGGPVVAAAAGGGQMGLPQPHHPPGGGLVGPGGQPMQVVQLQPGQPMPVVQLPPPGGMDGAGGLQPQTVVSLAPPPAPAAAPPQDDQTAALLRQVASMTDDQINALAPEHRAQVLFVKEQIRLGTVHVPL